MRNKKIRQRCNADGRKVVHQMNRNQYTTFSPMTKALSVILVAVLAIAVYAAGTEANRVRAEEICATGYILCKSYVLIRMAPSRKAPEIGQLDPADRVEVDGKTKDGFAHIISPMDGWVWAGYITFSEPKQVNTAATVTAKKRVACRKWCDGPTIDERPYLVGGSEVKVYWLSQDWAITNRGFVRTEWIEGDFDV